MFSPAEYILRKAAPAEENVVWNLLLPRIRRVVRDSLIYVAAGFLLALSVGQFLDLSLEGDLDFIFQLGWMGSYLMAGICAWPAITFRRDMRRRGLADDLVKAGLSGYQCLDAFAASFKAAIILWAAIYLPGLLVEIVVYFAIGYAFAGTLSSGLGILMYGLGMVLIALWMTATFWILLVMRWWGLVVAGGSWIGLMILYGVVPYGGIVALVGVLTISEIVIRRPREWCIANYTDRLARTY